MREFLKQANHEGLSPAEKDVFLYYESRGGKGWRCPDLTVAGEILRSRNSVCEARNRLLQRGWIDVQDGFQIWVLKGFSVGNSTEASRELDSPVENPTNPVESATPQSRTRLVYKDEEKPRSEAKELEKDNVASQPVAAVKSDAVAEIFAEWQSVLNHPNARLDKKRSAKIRDALAAGFSVDELKRVPHGVLRSSFHLGDNDRRTPYDGISTIFRGREQIEKFLDLAAQPIADRGGLPRHDPGRHVEEPGDQPDEGIQCGCYWRDPLPTDDPVLAAVSGGRVWEPCDQHRLGALEASATA